MFAIPKTWIITHIVCPHSQPGVSHRNDHFSRIRPWAAPPGPPSLSGERLQIQKHEYLFTNPFSVHRKVSCIAINISQNLHLELHLQLLPLCQVSACESKGVNPCSPTLSSSICWCFASQKPFSKISTLGSTFRSAIFTHPFLFKQ